MNLQKRALAAASALTALLASSLVFAAPAATEDIRDIRPPFAFPPWWRWPLAVAVAAALALAVVLLVRWWQKRRARSLTPLERARQALVVAEAHARAGQAHAWADIVAETLRGALAVRLGAGVLPQTTTELAQSVAEPGLIATLEACDLARFALASIDSEALLAQTQIARDLLEKLFAPPPPKTQTTPIRPLPVTPRPASSTPVTP